MLDTPETTLVVRSPEELAALGRLGGHPRVGLDGDSLPNGPWRRPWAGTGWRACPRAGTLSATCPRSPGAGTLCSVFLDDCPGVRSLEPLTGLPWRSWACWDSDLPGMTDPALDAFTGLTSLSMRGATPWPGADALPRQGTAGVPLSRRDTRRDCARSPVPPRCYQPGPDLDEPPAPDDWRALAGLEPLRS
ncbi:hypothetical protein AB0E75_11970 [Streptomyces griseoviridis]|uniref:hypothetical protein n=1 Tax=Streptomyces griseoviridis TaxID=45398 RepID=UPI0016798136|nr:hypothetical protein [Streptomyces niveoruber]